MAEFQGWRGGRRRMAIVGLCVLPWLVVGGALLPGVVRVMAQAEPAGSAPEARPPLRLSPPPGQRGPWSPLPVPRDLLGEPSVEDVALDETFRTDRVELPASDPAAEWVEQLLTFPHKTGDVIVQDEIGRSLAPIAFDDPILNGPLAQSDLPPPSPDAFPLNPLGDPTTLDEPLGPFGNDGPVAVPEPGAAGLLGAGIAVLALWRRGARSRGYFQPITS